MQSNREVFQEMREQEAFNNPQDYERPEERKPESTPYRLDLHARARDYEAAIRRNNYKAPMSDEEKESVSKHLNISHVDCSDFDFHKNGERDMTGRLLDAPTAGDLLYKTSDGDLDESEFEKMRESFKKLLNERTKS